MQLLTPAFLGRFERRVINVHPALLPAFPGLRAIEQAVEHGVKVFGVTVHFVDEGVDTGPIIAQRAIELTGLPGPEEVHAALRPLEHDLLCGVVEGFAAGAVAPDPSNPRRVEYRPTPMGGSQ
jgi:phosphoribosylglycinamide formyltransferase 1